MQQTKYPNVKNAHIVPRTYLKNWADDDRIGVVVPARGLKGERRLEKVGTRRRFYRRERPGDGTPIDDIEWSLSQGERVATPLLRSFADRWPLSLKDKATLGELFAFQLLRGTRWKQEYEGGTRAILDGWRRTGKITTPQGETSVKAADVDEAERAFLSNTWRLTSMMDTARKMSTVFSSMHWTLIEFGSAVVATSDHPLVLWPLDVVSRAPQPTPVTIGVFETIEVRLPLSPHHVVLMTWADRGDDEESRTRGTRDHARNINAFTVKQADRQWFHYPRTSPPVGTGKFLPVAPEIIDGYTRAGAKSSRRRATVSALIQPKIGTNTLGEKDFDVVYMASNPASGIRT